MAKTVPGTAQGTATSASSAAPRRPPERIEERAAVSPRATAPTVATADIQSELRIGRSRSGCEKSSR